MPTTTPGSERLPVHCCASLGQAGFAQPFVEQVVRRVRSNHYKRRLPIIAKLSARTVDRDFRYARDWGT